MLEGEKAEKMKTFPMPSVTALLREGKNTLNFGKMHKILTGL